MPKKIICPKCGLYQDNDKDKRKRIAKVKNFGKEFARTASKKIAGELAGAAAETFIEGSSSLVSKGVGAGVGNILDNWDVMKLQDVNSIKYQCCNCGCNWDGYDHPSIFNNVQKATVTKIKEDAANAKRGSFFGYMLLTVFCLLLVSICFWIWSNRHIDVEIVSTWLLGEQQVEHYSWHYYIFWPLIIISGISTLICLCLSIGTYGEYRWIKKTSIEDYATNNLNL